MTRGAERATYVLDDHDVERVGRLFVYGLIASVLVGATLGALLAWWWLA